ncbi:hypothetical protein C470_12293 [Halorubrum distributum JCM 13561]|uniref:Uncharacterized protein n=1 Tax=Halorubrum distributum JCM 13561 TaxID=1227483 RepID=M0NKW7_9EURY|nr:hypothetical protein [Halorubrum litoreum]EMA58456.1 hypothetical protein C470_12293 [Halorubrum litoreum JCM 13561]
MTETRTTRTRTTRTAAACALAALLVLATIAAGGVGTAAAQEDPETANEYFETFRAMEGTEAYQEYEEFETMRTFAVSRAQEVGTLDDADRAEFAAVLDTMVAFERAYERAGAGEYEASLAAAEEAEAEIDELESYEETQATLASLAVTRFYARLGDGLRDQASSAERTPDRIELLSMTATAYERANRPNEAAEFNLQAEQLSAEYDAAVERMDEAEATAGALLDQCRGCDTVAGAVGGNPVRTFERYQASQEALSEVQAAQADASKNGLDDRTADLRALASDVGDARFSLAVASTSILVGYGLVVGLIGTAVLSRVFLWRRTYEMAQIGSIVSGGKNDV